MKNHNTQAGYTLLELLVGATLLIVVSIAFGSYILKLTRGAAQINESQKVNEDLQVLKHNMRLAFEDMGGNMTMPITQTFSGSMPTPFMPHPDFPSATGERPSGLVDRIGTSDLSPLLSSAVIKGGGSVSESCLGCVFTVTDASTNRTWSMKRLWGSESSAKKVQILENGIVVKEVASEISSERKMTMVFKGLYSADRTESCIVSYRLENTDLYQSSYPCTNQFKSISYDISPGFGGIGNLTVSASEIIVSSSTGLPVRPAFLPLYDGARMQIPFTQNASTAVLLNGSKSQTASTLEKPMYLTQDLTFSGTGKVTLWGGDFSRITATSTVLLIDFINNRSVMLAASKTGFTNYMEAYPIDNVSGNETKVYFNSSLDKLRSSQGDYLNQTFPAGSRIVVLTSTEYAVRRDNGADGLHPTDGLYLRDSYNGNWLLLMPNVTSFRITPIITDTKVSFDVSLDVLSEGVEGSGKTENMHFVVSPRALNRTTDVR